MARNTIKKGEHRGKEFSSEYQPKNRRKPKLATVLKKQYGIDIDDTMLKEFGKGDIEDLLKIVLSVDPREAIVLGKKLKKDIESVKQRIDAGEAVTIGKKDKIWQIFVNLNNSVNKETNIGRSDTVKWIIEYLYGRATQPLESDVSVQSTSDMDLSCLSDEELRQLAAIQEKLLKAKESPSEQDSING